MASPATYEMKHWQKMVSEWIRQPKSTPSMWKILWALLAISITVLFGKALIQAYFTPLRKIPGPFLAKFTSLPLGIAGLKLQKCHYVDEAFDKYGPVVRLGPDMVVTNDREDVKKVYGSVKVVKAPFYDKFGIINNERSCLSLRDPTEAMHRRRCYLPLFARRNLLKFAPKIYEHLREFIEKLREIDSRGEVVDSVRWWRYLTFDVVTDLAFSGKFEMVKTGEKDHPFITDTDNAAKWGFLVGSLPLIANLPTWLVPKVVREWRDSEETSLKHPVEALARWKQEDAAGMLDKSRADAVEMLIKHGEQYPTEKLTEAQIIAAIQEIMVAGSDTTALAATMVCYEMARHPDMQEKLAAELKVSIGQDSSTPYTQEKLEAFEACPYLDAVCKEGLRMHPSVITILERVVPSPGMVLGGKYYIPPGTTVAMQACSRHKDPEVFPDPLAFRPERWLDENAKMKESMLAFSTGPRSCVGQNLAQMQLRLSVGSVLREFKVTLHPKTTEESMKKLDGFIGRPASGHCYLYYSPRK